MKRIASMLLLAFSAAASAQPPASAGDQQIVSYSITLLKDGKPAFQRFATWELGRPQVWSSSTPDMTEKTDCAWSGHAGDANWEGSVARDAVHKFDAMILPTAGDAGAINTFLDASVGYGNMDKTATVSGCVVHTGVDHTDDVVDNALMHAGDSRSFNLGNGRTLVLKLDRVSS